MKKKKAEEPSKEEQILASFGGMFFAIDKKTAKKMGVKPGQNLTEGQVEELLKPK